MNTGTPNRTKPSGATRGKSPLDIALRHLAPRARTVREMEYYLDSQEYGEYEVAQTVERLIELSYLDDAAFAREFIRTRLNTKPVSKRKLEEQLKGHFVPQDIIEAALHVINEDEEMRNALAIAEKYARQIEEQDAQRKEQRLIQRLTGRGFSFETSRSAAKAALAEET